VHTVDCGPEGIYLSALGARDGTGPGGVFLLDHFDFYDVIGLAVLRRSWINLDLIWCFSLLGAAAVLFFAPLA
jgi:selenium-binding protein 1